MLDLLDLAMKKRLIDFIGGNPESIKVYKSVKNKQRGFMLDTGKRYKGGYKIVIEGSYVCLYKKGGRLYQTWNVKKFLWLYKNASKREILYGRTIQGCCDLQRHKMIEV